MTIHELKGFEDFYPEAIPGTSQWFYGQDTPCAESYEVPEFQGNYPGTRLLLFSLDRRVFEPFSQEKNVFLEKPVYSANQDLFGLIRYDFNRRIIEAYTYAPLNEKKEKLCELSMDKAGDLINVRLITEPFMLVKHEIHSDSVDFLWPQEKHFDFEENESLYFACKDLLVCSRWVEDPDYREEILTRRFSDGSLLKREDGFITQLPDGSYWKMIRLQ